MQSTAINAFQDQAGWQALLDKQSHLFSALLPGAGIGILPRKNYEALNGTMLVWHVASGQVKAEYRDFTGFADTGVDLLFITDEEDLERVLTNGNENPFAEMKQLIRNGSIQFFSLKAQRELIDLGYEELIDAFGLPFQGACR